MSQDINEVNVGFTGAIYSFETDATLQWGANAALPATAKEHGFASVDGITVTGTRNTTNIMAWQEATLVRTVVTEGSVTYQFHMLQSNADNMELFYGTTKNATTGAYHWNASETGGRKSFIFDVIDKSRMKKFRHYVPSGEVTAVGAQKIASADAISYEVTITAYKVPVAGENANTLVWEDDWTVTPPVSP